MCEIIILGHYSVRKITLFLFFFFFMYRIIWKGQLGDRYIYRYGHQLLPIKDRLGHNLILMCVLLTISALQWIMDY